MTTGLLVLAVGLLFCWFAFSGWRTRGRDRISLLEAAILRATGADPLPINRFDRALHGFQLIMLSIFGPTAVALGLAILLY